MRVDEIETLDILPPQGGGLGKFQMPDQDTPLQIIGNIQGLTLVVVEQSSSKREAVLIDTKNRNEIAGKFDLSRYSDKANSWITSYSRLSKKYTGRKLAPKVYAKLVQSGYTLVSDRGQSPGGAKIWRDLIQVPGVFVYAFMKTPAGKTKYSQVFSLEQHAGDASFVIYDREHKQELNDLRELADDYEEITFNFEYSQEEQNHARMQMRKIDQMIAKLEKSISEESESARLIATAKQKNVQEAAGVGRITAQNRTTDVGVDEIKKQAAKFGNSVDKDGRPPLLYNKQQKKKTTS